MCTHPHIVMKGSEFLNDHMSKSIWRGLNFWMIIWANLHHIYTWDEKWYEPLHPPHTHIHMYAYPYIVMKGSESAKWTHGYNYITNKQEMKSWLILYKCKKSTHVLHTQRDRDRDRDRHRDRDTSPKTHTLSHTLTYTLSTHIHSLPLFLSLTHTHTCKRHQYKETWCYRPWVAAHTNMYKQM